MAAPKIAQEQGPQPDASLPSSERQNELRVAIEANEKRQSPPCAGILIKTRGELAWIMQVKKWSCDVDPGNSTRPDLRGANFTGTLLGDINLSGSDLRGARLTGTYLAGATLFGVRLADADLRRVNMSRAYLPDVDLTGTDCERANFQGAALVAARLGGAYLEQADLSGTDLWGAQFDVSTILRDILLDGKTQLGDVVWNGVPVAQVDWKQIRILGDEANLEAKVASINGNKGLSRRERRLQIARANRDVARAYRTLSIVLRQQGVSDVASAYRMREQCFERVALKAEGRRLSLLWSRILNLVAGYGERPFNALFAYLATIGVFMVVYLLLSNYVDTQLSHLSWDESLVLSVTSFHGRGFFPGTLPLGDWVARVAAVEAVIGLFIELVFIATFTHRFLGN